MKRDLRLKSDISHSNMLLIAKAIKDASKGIFDLALPVSEEHNEAYLLRERSFCVSCVCSNRQLPQLGKT